MVQLDRRAGRAWGVTGTLKADNEASRVQGAECGPARPLALGFSARGRSGAARSGAGNRGSTPECRDLDRSATVRVAADLGRSLRQGASGSRQDPGEVLNAVLGGWLRVTLLDSWVRGWAWWSGCQVGREGRPSGRQDIEGARAGPGGVRIEGRCAIARRSADRLGPGAVGFRSASAGPGGVARGRRWQGPKARRGTRATAGSFARAVHRACPVRLGVDRGRG